MKKEKTSNGANKDISYNGVTQIKAEEAAAYLFIKFDPGGLELLNDFSSAERILELSLRETLVLLGLAEALGGRWTARETVQGHRHVLRISYLF
jgi:hypothetical protein